MSELVPPLLPPVLLRPHCSTTSGQLPLSVPTDAPFIQFRHPGYQTGYDLMFRLSANDRCSPAADTDTPVPALAPQWGIHHGTALQACTIVACNLDGVLSPVRLGRQSDVPVSSPQDVLTESSYWFYPRGWSPTDEPYPVCPDFDNWQFPHESIPTDWMAIATGHYNGILPAPSQFSRVINERDSGCLITDFGEMTQVAHLVPKDERNWFMRNLMFNFNLNGALSHQYVTCDIANCLRLRQDLHTLFDTKSFTIVPKNATPVVHFLVQGASYCKEYHNRPTSPLSVNPAFLYARFAWAILPLIVNFARRREVRITVYNEDTTSWENTTAGEVAKKALADSTPKKRRRRARDDDAETEEAEEAGPAEPASVTHAPTHPSSVTEKLTDIFHKIVAKNPEFAWEGLGWHPDSDRAEQMRQKALAQREPVRHRLEIKRQREMYARYGALWDDEVASDSEDVVA